MKMHEELKALSDTAHERIDVLTSQYRAALKVSDHAMAAVVQGQRSAAVSYAQALEDCRLIVRQCS